MAPLVCHTATDPLALTQDISDIEENALGAFTQFILKLNEQTFRPIFLRTYDWAVIDLADAEATSEQSAQAGQRMVVLFKVVERLLVQLKVSFFMLVSPAPMCRRLTLVSMLVHCGPVLFLYARSHRRLARAILYWSPARLGPLVGRYLRPASFDGI